MSYHSLYSKLPTNIKNFIAIRLSNGQAAHWGTPEILNAGSAHSTMQSCGELTSGTGSTVESTAANAAHAVMLDVAHDQSPGRSVEHQADNDVKTLSNHFSILDSSSASGPVLSLGRCLVQGCCSNMVHCPFCDRQQYKPTQPARVRDHLYLSHFQHAVYFEGVTVLSDKTFFLTAYGYMLCIFLLTSKTDLCMVVC